MPEPRAARNGCPCRVRATRRYDSDMYPLLLVARDWFEVATGIAQMITALAIVGVAFFAVGTVLALRGAIRGLAKALEGAQTELVPLLQQARAIADDVKGMTSAASGEVARIQALVSETTTKAEAAVERVESRLRRLDALAGIVQDETEATVVKVASVVRGTTAAAATLREDLAGPEEDDALPPDDEEFPPEDDAPAPRVRPGRRRDR